MTHKKFKVSRTLEGEVEDVKTKTKRKAPVKYVPSSFIEQYIRDRDRDDYRKAILIGDLKRMEGIAKRHGFKVRDKDKRNCK